ncbi:hypothetical protein AAVH_22022 [Aphelenchoides avenae]|nr:hypothetical protein AAVH_22022 [Aphelenchus avenae]
MLEVLLWLDRFDLDGKQATTRRLSSLVENRQMPLRKVHRVEYNGEWRNFNVPPCKSSLSIFFRESYSAEIEIRIETDADAQKVVSYVSSCFVRYFGVFGHRDALPKNAIIAAPPLILKLEFRLCNFDDGEEDTLVGMLDGSTFQSLKLDRIYSSTPGPQIVDKRMEWLRLRGCNELHIVPYHVEPGDGGEKFKVSE